MAEEGTEVWVSSKLFALNDMLDGDKENHKNGVKPDLGSALCFPSEFPYESDFFTETSALASTGVCVQDSNETESREEEDFLAGLTRRLIQSAIRETRNLSVPSYVCERTEETLDLPHSPQSILSRMGSWSARSAVSSDGSLNSSSQVTSPTSTPSAVKNDNWDVIHAVAGQVTRLKIAAERPLKFDYQNREVLSASNGAPVIAVKNPNNALYPVQTLGQTLHQSSQFNKQVREDQILKQQCSSIWAKQAKMSWLAQQQQQQILNRGQRVGYQSCHCSRSTCLPHQAALPQNKPSRYSRSAIVGVPGIVAKRECAGTGVFLPRQYGKNTEPRKKTIFWAGCSPVVLPNRFVHIPGIVATKQPRFTAGYSTEHDAIMARRNAVLLQQEHGDKRGQQINKCHFHKNGLY